MVVIKDFVNGRVVTGILTITILITWLTVLFVGIFNKKNK